MPKTTAPRIVNDYYYNLTTGTKESLCTLAMAKKANNWKWQATSVREEQHQNHEHEQAKEQDQLTYNFIFWDQSSTIQQAVEIKVKVKGMARMHLRINLGNKSVLSE